MKKSAKFELKKANAKARRAAEQERRRSGPENVWRCPGTSPRLPIYAQGMGALGLFAALSQVKRDQPRTDGDGG